MLVMMLQDPWTVICYLDCDDAGADAGIWDMLQDGCDCLDDAGDMLSGLFELDIARPRLLLPFWMLKWRVKQIIRLRATRHRKKTLLAL